jgi:betaine-aldehyde dehydrogenase
MLVPASQYDEAARLAAEVANGFTVGDPLSERTRLGPLSSAAQLERVRRHIREAIAAGAQLLAGGAEPPDGVPAGGYYVRPTVFGRVDPASALAQEEVFGPVLSILAHRDDDEAVRIANGTRYGLAGAVWSGDEERARRIARRIRAGQVDVNGAPFNPHAPFGGFKESGYGREGGAFGLEEFEELKAIQLRA